MQRADHIPEPPLEPPEERHPRCPVCFDLCDKVYFDRFDRIVGCENCIMEADAWEEMDNDGL